MRALCGTSGFSYDEWHGRFYPADLPASERLGFYSSRLGSVEINNTFYQTPKAPLLERWRDAVPESFRFALKAPRRITHIQRLRGSSDSLSYFWQAASVLGPKLGPVLFQLPPFARKDAPLLAEFLATLPPALRPAFEFRHPSWFDDEIYALLSARGAALCGGDAEEGDRSPPLVATTDFGYLRLRAPSYDAGGLATWCERLRAEPWETAYVYLKHEVLGPDYAGYLAALAAGEPAPSFPPPLAPATSEEAKPSPGSKPRAKSGRKGAPASAAKPSAAKPTAAKPTAAKPTAAKPTAAKATAAKPTAAKPGGPKRTAKRGAAKR